MGASCVARVLSIKKRFSRCVKLWKMEKVKGIREDIVSFSLSLSLSLSFFKSNFRNRKFEMLEFLKRKEISYIDLCRFIWSDRFPD